MPALASHDNFSRMLCAGQSLRAIRLADFFVRGAGTNAVHRAQDFPGALEEPRWKDDAGGGRFPRRSRSGLAPAFWRRLPSVVFLSEGWRGFWAGRQAACPAWTAAEATCE